MRKIGLALIALLLLSATIGPLHVGAESRQSVGQLGDLSFGLRITPGLVEWFNQNARPNDVAATTAKEAAILDQITAGKKQVLFASAAEAEQLAPSLAGKIDIISYDLEHWPQTPQDEQADPVAAIKRMRALADKYNWQLGIGPDRRFEQQYGTQLVAYVDQFALQVQRLQTDPQALQNFAAPLIQQLRQANPKIKIVAQVRTEGGIDALLPLVDSIKGDIDGIGILYTPQTLPIVKDFVARLRSGQPVPTLGPTLGRPEPTPTLIGAPTPAPTIAPVTVVTPQPSELLPGGSSLLPILIGVIGLLLLVIVILAISMWQRGKRTGSK
jgi:hypothetical protein